MKTKDLLDILDEHIRRHKGVERYQGDLTITYAAESGDGDHKSLYVKATDVLGGGEWEVTGVYLGQDEPDLVLANYEDENWAIIYHRGYYL